MNNKLSHTALQWLSQNINHNKTSCWIEIRLWSHKGHPTAHPHRLAMGCFCQINCTVLCSPGSWGGGGQVLGCFLGMINTARWLEMLQRAKKGGRNCTCWEILTKNRGRNTSDDILPHFCSNIGVQTIEIFQRPEKGELKWRSICINLQRVRTLPGSVLYSQGILLSLMSCHSGCPQHPAQPLSVTAHPAGLLDIHTTGSTNVEHWPVQCLGANVSEQCLLLDGYQAGDIDRRHLLLNIGQVIVLSQVLHAHSHQLGWTWCLIGAFSHMLVM